MSLPQFQRTSFEPSEMIFITKTNESIEIIPNFKLSKFRSINGNLIGPLIPLKSIKVPLWFAIQIKKSSSSSSSSSNNHHHHHNHHHRFGIKICCPNWLKIEHLKSKLNQEIQFFEFSDLPFYWLEISKVLIEVAPEDIPSLDQVRPLLKSLRETRQSKTRTGLTALDTLHLSTPNLSSLELNELRPIFTNAHLRLLQLDPKQDSYDLSNFELHLQHQQQQQSSSSSLSNLNHHQISSINTSQNNNIRYEQNQSTTTTIEQEQED